MSSSLLQKGITWRLFFFAYWVNISRSQWRWGKPYEVEWAFLVWRKGSAEENSRQLVGWVIRHGCCLLRKADAHNVPLFDSSLHKKLIYTLCSSSASLLIFTRTCVFCCVVTDQHNYATGKNDTVSPPQSPLSAFTVSVSRPLEHISSPPASSLQQWCPVLRWCPGEPEENGELEEWILSIAK